MNDYVEHIRPYLHVFGHIHAAYGKFQEHDQGTIYVNGSNIRGREGLVNPPIVVDLRIHQ